MSFLENIFCQGPIKDRIQLQQQCNAVEGNLVATKLKLADAQVAVGVCQQNKDADTKMLQAQIVDLTQRLSVSQSDLATCNAVLEAEQSILTLYQKPVPALISAVDGKKVMLGQAYIKNNAGSFYLTYPSHGAIFFPCPIYEGVLTSCDCNRKRSDLSPIQICMKIANTIQRQMHYLSDQTQWGVLDVWTPAPLVLMLGQEDCESLTQNICSAIMYYEQKFGVFASHSVFCGLGHLVEGQNSYGHSFVVVLNHTSTDPKDSYIIEATLTYEASPMPLSDAKSSYQIDWGLIGFTNNSNAEGSYVMNPTYSWWGAPAQMTGSISPEESKLHRILRKLFGWKSEGDKKGDLIRRIWESKRR